MVRSCSFPNTDPQLFSTRRVIFISLRKLLYRLGICLRRIAVYGKRLISRPVNLRRTYWILRPIFVELRGTFIGRRAEPDFESIKRFLWIRTVWSDEQMDGWSCGYVDWCHLFGLIDFLYNFHKRTLGYRCMYNSRIAHEMAQLVPYQGGPAHRRRIAAVGCRRCHRRLSFTMQRSLNKNRRSLLGVGGREMKFHRHIEVQASCKSRIWDEGRIHTVRRRGTNQYRQETRDESIPSGDEGRIHTVISE
jgi:hypothetical protein